MDIFALSGSTRVLVAVALALVPAASTYLRGRQIARLADDPALPERLLAGRHVTSGSLAVTIAALMMLTGRAAIWAIPLAVVAHCAAGLPLRRILYNETWSLAVYLSFVIRVFTAFWGFWALVCALPALAFWAGEHAGVAALLVGAGLMVLETRYTEVVRWLIGARPIMDEAIRARFGRLVGAAGLAPPHFEFVDLKGGSIANAFALPSLGRASVVFSLPLLRRLDADEVDAICAHELAHLEYYSPRRLRRHRLVSRALIVAGALLTPALQQVIPSLTWLAAAAWPAVVLAAIALLVQGRQKHETASDLRAVALAGNPEALVRALVKLHLIARVPRRWDADLERHMSHPSLKRRIQDIRGAAGTPPATLGDAAVFDSADGTARVVFGDESLEWSEGSSASYRVRYERLSELRIAAVGTGAVNLTAADRTGYRWQMALRSEDVPRIQAVLDIVDTRVEAAVPATATAQPVLVRAFAFIVFIVSLHSGLIAVAMVFAATLVRTEAPIAGAAGLAAIGGAVLMWRDPAPAYTLLPEGFDRIFVPVLLVAGALFVCLAYTRRRDEVPAPVWKLVGGVAAAALASWMLPLAGGGMDALGLYQAAREWPSSVVFPLALAGALMWPARRMLRAASAVAVVASAIAAGVGSQAFLDRFGGDLFLVPAADVMVRTLDRPVKEFTVPFGVSHLQLSPGGQSIAAAARNRDDRATIHIGRAGGALTPVEADGALFIDEDRALVWTADGSRTDLREVRVAAPDAPGWQLRVTGVSSPVVSLDPTSKRWRLASEAGESVVEAREGTVGTDEVRSYQWRVPARHGAPFMPIAVSGNRALALEPRFDLASPAGDPFGAFMFVLASAPRWRSTVWALGPDGARDLGTSRLQLECRLLPLADRGACHIFDASRTRFFAMDAEKGGIEAVASLPGRFYVGDNPQGAWMTGWHQSGTLAVRLAPVDAIRVVAPDGARAHVLAVSDRAAAGVWYHIPVISSVHIDPMSESTSTSIIRIYPID